MAASLPHIFQQLKTKSRSSGLLFKSIKMSVGMEKENIDVNSLRARRNLSSNRQGMKNSSTHTDLKSEINTFNSDLKSEINTIKSDFNTVNNEILINAMKNDAKMSSKKKRTNELEFELEKLNLTLDDLIAKLNMRTGLLLILCILAVTIFGNLIGYLSQPEMEGKSNRVDFTD